MPEVESVLSDDGNGDDKSLATRAYTVQEPKGTDQTSSIAIVGDRLLAYLMRVTGTITEVPAYGNILRDQWMDDFIHSKHCDLLAGAISTVAAKIVSTPWYVEGPLALVVLARKMLLFWSEHGDGWDSMAQKWVRPYLSRDFGGTISLRRTSASDHTGPALGYDHLDESKCNLTGSYEYPITYNHDKRGIVKVHQSQVARIVDMPSSQQRHKGLGWCGASRAITTAQVLADVVRYKRERLSDLPPAGLLILSNLSPDKWDDLSTQYDARMENRGNEVWRNLMVACGVDPAYPTTAELVPFSELPAHFNEKEATEIAVYSFALAFREDPREFWPVSSGPLGTATETEIQHLSARSKGEGIIYTAIERQLNRPECLSEGVTFHFDFQDDEEDLLRARINDAKTKWIRRLWEASPNRAPEVEGAGEGMISTEQVQQLLVREKVVPADILGLTVDIERLYDIKSYDFRQAMFGPKVRLYQNGLCVKA